jgi:hypothetical protein
MRTYFNVVITNRNVFGYGQDRVVSALNATCAHAAQHHASRHASKRARESAQALKRLSWSDVAGAVSRVRDLCPAIMGPQWRPVRLMSPTLVTA